MMIITLHAWGGDSFRGLSMKHRPRRSPHARAEGRPLQGERGQEWKG